MIKDADTESTQAARSSDAHAGLGALGLWAQNEELRAAYEALEIERRRYHDLFDFAPDGYLITDRHARITEANRAAADLLGVAVDALAGKPLTHYVAPDDVPALSRRMGLLAGGMEELPAWEMRLHPHGREAIDVSVKVTAAGSGRDEPDQLQWLIRDVTGTEKARREHQELLSQAAGDRDVVEELAYSFVEERDLLQTIMENTRTCLAYFDRDLQVLRMNLACAYAWECTGQDLVECSRFRLHPEEENEALLTHVFETGEPISFRAAPSALEAGVKDETTYWDWRLVPVKDADGQVHGVVLSMQDVTGDVQAAAEREHLLEGSRRQREFLEGLIEAAPLAIGVMRGPDHCIELANSFFLELPGKPNRPMLGRPVAEVLPQAAMRGRDNLLDEVYRTGETISLRQLEIGSQPGCGQRYLDVDYIPLRDPEGEVDGVLIVGHDVTEEVMARRQIEALAMEARRKAEELNAVFEAMAETVMVYDAAGTMVFANRAARDLHVIDVTDTGRQELIRRLAIWLADGHVATVEALPVNRALHGETVVGERLVFVDGEGDKHVVLASAAPVVVDGERQGAVAVWYDVTEREEALAQLAGERARLKAIVDNAPEGIMLADSEARVVLSNPAAERVFARPVPYGEEYEAHARMQIHHPDGTPWDPRDLPLTRSALDGETGIEVEQLIAWPDGQQRRLLVNTVPIRDDEGQVTGAVGVFQDVTDKVAVREKLRRQNEELEAYDYTVAHDLKNPLTMVTGSADLLNEVLKDEDAPGPQRMVRNILEGTRRMNEIVESLLLLTSTRRHEVEEIDLDMAKIVTGACDMLASAIERSDARLRVATSWPNARGFAPWVESVWSNYLSNALKYGGEPPHVELGWSALDDQVIPVSADLPALTPTGLAGIRSQVDSPASKVLFWVRDHGPGLAEQAQSRLFVEFTRLDRPGKLGHGLGLAIVRRIVETLGGEVGVESQPGEGCTFWFTLPKG